MFTRKLRNAAMVAAPIATILVASPAFAQSPGLSALNALCIDMFGSSQQPRVPFETRSLSPDGTTTFLSTPHAILPEGDAFGPTPPNLLPTVYEDVETCRGNKIPNTLPSTPENPYNLHPDPIVTPIDKTSPTDDLDWIMDEIEVLIAKNKKFDGERVSLLAGHAVDIIEGNPLSGELAGGVYEGFPLLHYLGGLKTKSVDPVTKTVTVNQIWYDSHIESDTSYIDPTIVDDEEWTIRYVVNVLNRGHDDFAPYAMFFDDPNELDFTVEGGPNLKGARIPNVGIDQTFFPMEDGNSYVFEMKMPPARFWNLTYHWGWRVHPPRVQVVENVDVPLQGNPRNFAEIGVFGANPRESEEAKLAAIGMIGDMAPAKRMWQMFREIRDMGFEKGKKRKKHKLNLRGLRSRMKHVRQAFYDWQNRNKLPTGFKAKSEDDITLLFINNTIYGEVDGHDGDAEVTYPFWTKRGDTAKIKLLNGDYFVHAYVLVDFGGLRGWENTFHNTLPVGGAGPLFTFGRNHFWINIAGGGPIPIPPAERQSVTKHGKSIESMERYFKKKGHKKSLRESAMWGGRMNRVAKVRNVKGIGSHTVEVTFNYEPSRRLRMYQFDALHHDVAVWSVH